MKISDNSLHPHEENPLLPSSNPPTFLIHTHKFIFRQPRMTFFLKKKEAKNAFEKDFFKLMNNAVFGKTMGNVRKYIKLVRRHIKLVTTERRNCLPTEPNYHTTRFFIENLSSIELKK